MDNVNQRISLTPTVERQTPKSDFGEALKTVLQTGASAVGSLANLLPGGGALSTAITSAASGAGGAAVGAGAGSGAAGGSGLSGELAQMKAQADESLALQIQMQNESREFNTLSNVIKVRHDAAKGAINNIH